MRFQNLFLLATCALAASVYADECKVEIPVGLTRFISCHGKIITKVVCSRDIYDVKRKTPNNWEVECKNWIENCDCTVFTE